MISGQYNSLLNAWPIEVMSNDQQFVYEGKAGVGVVSFFFIFMRTSSSVHTLFLCHIANLLLGIRQVRLGLLRDTQLRLLMSINFKMDANDYIKNLQLPK